MKSIRRKILFIVFSSGLLTLLISGGIGIYLSDSAIRRDSARILDLMTQIQTDGLNAMFADIEQSSNVIARYVKEDLDSLDVFHNKKEFDDYIKKLEQLTFYIANCTSHAMAAYVRFAPELTDEVSSVLWRKVDGVFQKDSMSVFPVYDSRFENSWYYKARMSQQGAWTTPYYNDDFNEYVVSFGIPVYKDGKFFAVVGMDIDFDDIAYLVNSISIYNTGYAFLTDEDFMVIYHRSIPANTLIVDQTSEFKHLTIRGISSDFYQYTFKNETFRMAYKKLANGMRLVVSVPAHEIDKDRNELVVMLLVVVSLLSVFISFWCVYMSNRIIRPLNELMTSTRKIVAGDYDLDFKHRSNDEIGELMGTFLLMAKSLKTQFEFINRLVYLDSMTGAKNKRAFIDERNEINTKINESLRVGKRFDFGVIVFDVNNLKYLNDNFGHNAGDALIKNSYSLIRNHFEESPVFRIGGDEFVAVIIGKEYENRVELLTKFRSEMDYLSEHKTEPSEKVSIASGLAVFKPECDTGFQAVFERADEEMYKAKVAMKGGRDMVR